MSALAVVRPLDIPTLREAMIAGGDAVHFVAGGTDLLVGRRLPRNGILIDLSRVAGLASISARVGDIRIGAATTLTALAANPELRERLAALTAAAEQCGSVQIRNRATIGGNIANAAPAADLVTVLIAAEARLAVMKRDGSRHEVALADYLRGSKCLVTEIVLPEATLLPRSAFAKLGSRSHLTISRLNLTLFAEFDGAYFGRVRLAAGAIGPMPRKLDKAAAALEHRRLEVLTLRDFLSALVAEVDAAIPGRASLSYKRRAVGGLALELVAEIAGLDPREPIFEEAIA